MGCDQQQGIPVPALKLNPVSLITRTCVARRPDLLIWTRLSVRCVSHQNDAGTKSAPQTDTTVTHVLKMRA